MPPWSARDDMDARGDAVANGVVFALSIWGDHAEYIF